MAVTARERRRGSLRSRGGEALELPGTAFHLIGGIDQNRAVDRLSQIAEDEREKVRRRSSNKAGWHAWKGIRLEVQEKDESRSEEHDRIERLNLFTKNHQEGFYGELDNLVDFRGPLEGRQSTQASLESSARYAVLSDETDVLVSRHFHSDGRLALC